MIDYWEALGRTVHNEVTGHAFAKIAKCCADKLPRKVPFCVPLDIEDADYKAVQKFWESELTQPYLSLMAAGELIWSYYFDLSRKKIESLRKLVIDAKPKLVNPSTTYFISLGLIIADELFRDQVAGSKLEALSSGQLSTQEKANLVSLASNSIFSKDAKEFCEFPWDVGCNVRYVYWEGHLHPRGIDYKTKSPDSTWKSRQPDHDLVGTR